MAFDPFSINLPVTDIIQSVRESLSKDQTLIVTAPPGAGKSTLIPLSLLHEPWLSGKKIIMLEPRRLAAKTIAARMASLLGEELGQTIGYRIRFETRVSEQTKIEVVTEGILTRMIHSDNSLEGVGLVIFDEFHERSIHADVAMAFCREVQQVLREDLRMLVMSATLDMITLSELLQAPVIESKGKQYPVDIIYCAEKQDFRLLPEMAAQTIQRALKEQDGDILVFLPGQGEIKRCETILKKTAKGIAIFPLYGQLPPHKQRAAILPHKEGKRKVVLATSIAETSLTIEGIKVVIDSGFARTSKFDLRSGLSRLETIQVTKDSADQRAGRAGRLSSGTCYRMWSAATQHRLEEHRVPEILEADLAALVLDIAQWGHDDIMQLAWLSPPPLAAVAQATDILEQLEALEYQKITDHGKQLHKLPCHPRLAHLMVKAQEDGLLELATDLSAILEERDPLGKEAGIDINLRIEALRKHREENRDGRKLAKIEKVASSYRRLFQAEADNSFVDPYETGVLLAYAYPERIAFARPGNNAQFQLANGKYASASHRDDLAHESWLAIANVDARDGMGKIFLASPLNPKDLARLVKQEEVIEWDTRKGGLIASTDLRIGTIVLKSVPIPNPDESRLEEAISNAIKKEGEHLLNFDETVTTWQNRVMSLKKWNPKEKWPDVSTSTLTQTNAKWLMPYLSDIKKPEDLKKLDLVQILQHSLDWEKQEALDKLAPLKIQVPSGSFIKIAYQNHGQPPILAVRIQELFGLADTPKINNQRTELLLHLLSPGFKPVQVTTDLRSFWDNTYFEVRKELKRRYPKHAWPDDPWTEEAVRGVKRKKKT